MFSLIPALLEGNLEPPPSSAPGGARERDEPPSWDILLHVANSSHDGGEKLRAFTQAVS